MNRIALVEKSLEDYRKKLLECPLYNNMKDLNDVSLFMESHVYAVWDFMSLLKALQIEFTSVALPWKPKKNAKLARFINEIVWAEESDWNESREPKSHFEMYLDAMREVGADSTKIMNLLARVEDLNGIKEALKTSDLNRAEYDFLSFTFDTIQTGKAHLIASAFTFGREDLIPDMFLSILHQAEKDNMKRFPKLRYYLERHIEVDGDEHGPLALEMIQELCGEDNQKWAEVLEVAKIALQKRIGLWNYIAEKL